MTESAAAIKAQLELAELRVSFEERGRHLAESLDRLRKLEEARQAFVHMAAHDMRSPLMAVAGYIELLGDPAIDPAARAELVARASEGTHNLSRLVDAMLDLARLEANRMAVTIEPHDPRRVIERAMRRLGPLSATRVDVEMPADLPRMACDAELTSRVAANLLSNALKYSDEPERVVLRAAASGGSIGVLVEDQGPGVSEEVLAKLFEELAAAPRSDARGKSTGLGLAFCRMAVDVQGGTIGYIPPDRGAGARFWLTLPIAPSGGAPGEPHG